jgi:protein-S-isoprenylcysteine O-methyltransferase Ste14
MPINNDGKPDEDRPNSIHWPPVLYFITLAAAHVLQRLIPLPSPFSGLGLSDALPGKVGWPLFGFGVILGLIAIYDFRKIGTAVDPTAPANRLATEGIYAATRNPMYLGAILAFAGLGIARGWTWLLILASFLPNALYTLAISREEAYLERRFGDAYRTYKSKVGRWF